MFAWIDLIRLFAGFALLYAALPYAAFGRGSSLTAAVAFVQTAFFFQVSAMVLGDWGLYLPGAAASLYLVFLGAAFVLRSRALPARQDLFVRLLAWLDRGGQVEAGTWAARGREFFSMPLAAGLLTVAAAAVASAAGFALHHVRMERIESYGRAISLRALLHGAQWDHDAGVVWLAPLTWSTGLTADAVVRLSGPLVAVALLAAAAWSAWRCLGSLRAALSCATVFAVTMMASNLLPREPGAADWASVLMVVAFGLARPAPGTAALAVLTALLAHRGVGVHVLIAAMSIAAGSLLESAMNRVPGARVIAPAACALAALLAALFSPAAPHPEPLQYDAAARAAHRIASEFRTNDWTIVSPGFEVAQTLGRGWHVEAAKFVDEYSEAQVKDPKFRFAYPTDSLFVFVEKRVLNQPTLRLTGFGNETSYYYGTRLGRASLEFRAAQLMTAYRAAHPGQTQVYYEDEDIVIYRIDTAAAAPNAAD